VRYSNGETGVVLTVSFPGKMIHHRKEAA